MVMFNQRLSSAGILNWGLQTSNEKFGLDISRVFLLARKDLHLPFLKPVSAYLSFKTHGLPSWEKLP